MPRGYNFTLRDNSKGQTKVIYMELEYEMKGGGSFDGEFWWTEGNFSGDCYRLIEFYPEDDFGSPSCGEERFTLIKIEDLEGNTLLRGRVDS